MKAGENSSELAAADELIPVEETQDHRTTSQIKENLFAALQGKDNLVFRFRDRKRLYFYYLFLEILLKEFEKKSGI